MTAHYYMTRPPALPGPVHHTPGRNCRALRVIWRRVSPGLPRTTPGAGDGRAAEHLVIGWVNGK